MRRRVRHTDLLGTVVEAEATRSFGSARAPLRAARTEIERLTTVFDAFDAGSELRRLHRSEITEPGPELGTVIALAQEWFERSAGVFDPGVGGLRRVWGAAAAAGRVPTPAELDAARPDPGAAPSDLNAIAKGWIIDRAVELAKTIGHTSTVWLNAGGDVRHLGRRPARIAIESPSLVGGPVDVVELRNGALATSGAAHRGWTVAGRRVSHVLDPRTGHPAPRAGSVSVVAPDAATADVLATIATVDEEIGRSLIGETELAAARFDRLDGSTDTTAGWPSVRPSRAR